MSRGPAVSVIIPTYNVERYLKETLNSVSSQVFKDLEIIVVDDGSSDQSVNVAAGHDDRRLRLVRHQENRGVAAARNTGLDHATGEFVAILDGDDVAHPLRILKQVGALLMDPGLGLVGSQVAVMDEVGKPMPAKWARPTEANDAAIGLLFRNTFSACFTFRRSAIPDGMFGSYPMAEDYQFVSQLATKWKVKNTADKLTTVRVRRGGLTHTKRELMEKYVRLVARDQLHLLNVDPSPAELDVNRHIGALTLESSMSLLDEVDAWLQKLVQANDRLGSFDRAAFLAFVGREWLEVCRFASGLGMNAYKRYWSSQLSQVSSAFAQPKFFAKCALRHCRPGGDYPF